MSYHSAYLNELLKFRYRAHGNRAPLAWPDIRESFKYLRPDLLVCIGARKLIAERYSRADFGAYRAEDTWYAPYRNRNASYLNKIPADVP